MRYLVVALLPLGVAGCTSVQVRPLDPALHVTRVCIQENPDVIVKDFLPVLREGFQRHNIATDVYSTINPEACPYVLRYTALQSWDFALYLSHAELRLEHDGKQIGYAEYHLKGKGGLSVAKWQSVKTKMDPVIDSLLK
ncbi:Sbal_3080 family lipoprotein [Luteibacter sp. UNCMF366Tsu5.1]|uniref:Sbal_3080 family lipoprotein n=1 Tax=Luteibacter sp. UNCMF366Tsu5.1 TaxID=1502758 RepID=UPI000908F5E3|nr:Sbal_3080 family lipoprotein [Luteibacter sp. UNCMF366Tsu5.1]SFW42520.1 hypothetical protein SAMN02800691_1740 [Luteibacter sp. UNCMF366Tsu5.1]